MNVGMWAIKSKRQGLPEDWEGSKIYKVKMKRGSPDTLHSRGLNKECLS